MNPPFFYDTTRRQTLCLAAPPDGRVVAFVTSASLKATTSDVSKLHTHSLVVRTAPVFGVFRFTDLKKMKITYCPFKT